MARAVLFGGFMGLLIGGMILAVLALQISVVEWPEVKAIAATPAETTDAEDSPTIDAPPPDGRVVTAETGPDDPKLPGLAELAASPAARDRLREVAGMTTTPERTPEASPLGETPEPRAVVRLRNPPETRAAELGNLQIFVPPKRSRPNRATVEPVTAIVGPLGLDLSSTLPLAPELGGVSAAAIESSRAAVALTDGPWVPSTSTMGTVGHTEAKPVFQTNPTALAATPPTDLAPRFQSEVPASNGPSPEVIDPADPLVIAGRQRPPMILWIAPRRSRSDLPPWVTPVGTPEEGARLVSLPPPDDPEALAGFLAELRRSDTRPEALLIGKSPRWSALLLAPFLNRPELRDLPLILPTGVAPEVIDLLAARGERILPVYAQLNAAPTPLQLAQLSARARRDGLVVVELSDALIETWQQDIGFDPATLRDAFGG